MAFDYPDLPADGNEFTPPNGPTYVWDTVAWRRKSSAPAVTPPPLGGVVHDASLTGDGTAASPLSVALVDSGGLTLRNSRVTRR